MAVEGPGCVILLIDESTAMASPVQEEAELTPGQPPRTKGESVATAVNSLIKQLGSGPDFELALVGYQSDPQGKSIAASRWGGPLAGSDFVRVSALADSPMRVEERQRKIPDPASISGFRSEAVPFPIWYAAQPAGIAPQVLAYQYCKDLLSKWAATSGETAGPPLLIHIHAAGSGDGNPLRAIEEIRSLALPNGSPQLFQLHLSSAKSLPSTLYPSNRAYLPAGAMRDLFDRSSPLSPGQVQALKESKIPTSPNARGMAHNAKMIDVVRFLALVKAHAKGPGAPAAASPGVPPPPAYPMPGTAQPPAVATSAAAPAATATAGGPVAPAVPDSGLPAVETAPVETASVEATAQPVADSAPTTIPLADAPPEDAPEVDRFPTMVGDALTSPDVYATVPGFPDVPDAGEKRALLLLLLDRSVADPYGADPRNSCTRLLENANELLGKLAKAASGQIDVAVVSYGSDAMGQPDVRMSFDGALAGKSIVADSELSAGVLRTDELEQQVPNGVGGLMTISIKKPVYLELDPTAGCSAVPAFDAARGLLGEWCSAHAEACLPPVVLHLTRGRLDAADARAAVEAAQQVSIAAGPVVVYHQVATDGPHDSLSYPDSDSALQTPELQCLWQLSSPLLGRAQLSVSKPALVKGESRGMVVNGKFDLLLDGIKEVLAR